jgi:hypothetical protein
VGLTHHNYILYTHDDFQPPVLHGETEETQLNPPAEPPVILNPLNHFLENGWRTFSAVMVADDTLYDPDTGGWLVSGWFSRTAAAANRANFYWVWAQWGPQIPASATTLPSGVRNNGLRSAASSSRSPRLHMRHASRWMMRRGQKRSHPPKRLGAPGPGCPPPRRSDGRRPSRKTASSAAPGRPEWISVRYTTRRPRSVTSLPHLPVRRSRT